MSTLTGNITLSLPDCSYFSFTTYTTLGYGDIEPGGYLRFLTGLESLTGLVMITGPPPLCSSNAEILAQALT